MFSWRNKKNKKKYVILTQNSRWSSLFQLKSTYFVLISSWKCILWFVVLIRCALSRCFQWVTIIYCFYGGIRKILCGYTLLSEFILMFTFLWAYCIRSNYRTYPYKRTVKKFCSLQITASVIFLYFFLKAYVVGTHLNCIDLSMQFDAIQMSAHNICLYKENQKQSHNHHQISPFSDLFYSVSLVGRYIFYHKWVFPVILKNLSAQCGN